MYSCTELRSLVSILYYIYVVAVTKLLLMRVFIPQVVTRLRTIDLSSHYYISDVPSLEPMLQIRYVFLPSAALQSGHWPLIGPE